MPLPATFCCAAGCEVNEPKPRALASSTGDVRLRDHIAGADGGAVVGEVPGIHVHGGIPSFMSGVPALGLRLPAGLPTPEIHRVVLVAHAEEAVFAGERELQRRPSWKSCTRMARFCGSSSRHWSSTASFLPSVTADHGDGVNLIRLGPERIERHAHGIERFPETVHRAGLAVSPPDARGSDRCPRARAGR
jgi:hypothetical protein